MRKTIAQTFQSLRALNQIALMPFIPAGYPDLGTTREVIPALERGGASLIEVGIPFSDPIADGPVIQAAFTDALAKGLKLADIFKTIGTVRESVSIPLVAMVSYSLVFRVGLARFCTNAKMAGFDGLILPDLPPPEAQAVCSQVRSAGLETILLVAPTTPEHRQQEIAKLSSGFVYYLSVSGITGERTALPADLSSKVSHVRQLSNTPVCVGFGISKAEHVRHLKGVADGAIVGSAIVRRMSEHKNDGPTTIATACEQYCGELLSLVK